MTPEQDRERRLTRALIFYKDDIDRIETALDRYQADSKSQCNLLVNQDGHLVTQTGALEGVDLQAVAALVAGAFAATREIARSLGEEDFTSLSHQGPDESVQLTLVGDRTILATIYSPRTTTAGLVRFYLGAVASTLRSILEIVAARPPRPASERGTQPWIADLGDDLGLAFGHLFGED